MNPAFAGPEFGDEFGEEEATQLTLGTTSLLSIFFGLVMICGIFFGLGYTFGRRSFAQLAMQKQPPASVVGKTAPPAIAQASAIQSATSVPVQNTSMQMIPPSAIPSPVSHLAPVPSSPSAEPTPLAATTTKTAVLSQNTPAVAKTNVSAFNGPAASAAASTKPPVPVATLLANKTFLPKPSAIQPVLVQPHTNVAYLHGVPMPPNPYEAAQLPWKWTPPFDVVHPGSNHSRGVRAHESRLNPQSAAHANAMQAASTTPNQANALPSTHTVLVIQIAALSRQDDAQVLADSLRKRGFVASIQNGNDDALYHVQMGPLERRVALVTQQRLIARGYNAVVK